MSTRPDIPAIDKQAIRETLAGYAVAAEYLERERVERLRQLTPENSWQIFLELLETGRMFLIEDNTLTIFDQRQVEALLHLRQMFDRASKIQGAR